MSPESRHLPLVTGPQQWLPLLCLLLHSLHYQPHDRQPHCSGAAQHPRSRARVAKEIADTLPELLQAGFCSSPKGKCYGCLCKWQSGLAHLGSCFTSPTHTYPPGLSAGPGDRLAAGWQCGGALVCVWGGGLLGDSEKSTAWKRSKFREWRGKRSQQSREYVLEKKSGCIKRV